MGSEGHRSVSVVAMVRDLVPPEAFDGYFGMLGGVRVFAGGVVGLIVI